VASWRHSPIRQQPCHRPQDIDDQPANKPIGRDLIPCGETRVFTAAGPITATRAITAPCVTSSARSVLVRGPSMRYRARRPAGTGHRPHQPTPRFFVEGGQWVAAMLSRTLVHGLVATAHPPAYEVHPQLGGVLFALSSSFADVVVDHLDDNRALPTAAATRFTDRARTSPAAKTPGTLVSSIVGWRRSGHDGGGLPPRRSS
jgi:hypothetical protein